MGNKLKPCPFCGGEVSMVYNSQSGVFKFWHKGLNAHKDCCVSEPILVDADSLADARQKWNRRADDGK